MSERYRALDALGAALGILDVDDDTPLDEVATLAVQRYPGTTHVEAVSDAEHPWNWDRGAPAARRDR